MNEHEQMLSRDKFSRERQNLISRKLSRLK